MEKKRRSAKRQDFVRLQRSYLLTSLRAEQFDTRNKSEPGVVYFSVGQPDSQWLWMYASHPHCNPAFFSNARKAKVSDFGLRAAEDRTFEQHSQQYANIDVQFIPIAFDSFVRLSELVRETLKRIALLTDNRSLHSADLSVAFSRLAQSVLVTLMQGDAIMFIARSAYLRSNTK